MDDFFLITARFHIKTWPFVLLATINQFVLKPQAANRCLDSQYLEVGSVQVESAKRRATSAIVNFAMRVFEFLFLSASYTENQKKFIHFTAMRTTKNKKHMRCLLFA